MQERGERCHTSAAAVKSRGAASAPCIWALVPTSTLPSTLDLHPPTTFSLLFVQCAHWTCFYPLQISACGGGQPRGIDLECRHIPGAAQYWGPTTSRWQLRHDVSLDESTIVRIHPKCFSDCSAQSTILTAGIFSQPPQRSVDRADRWLTDPSAS